MITEITASESVADASAPIVIDLGKKNRKRIRKLRKGKGGKLSEKVTEVLGQMKEAGALPAHAQPVVVIVRERKRKSKYTKLWGMG